MEKIRVFSDTNIILESFRTKCWKEISSYFSIETVDKCVEETLTGNSSRSNYIEVQNTELKEGLNVIHKVNDKDILTLVQSYPFCNSLDDGEQQLYAFLFAKKVSPSKTNLLSTADKAALKACHDLGWLSSTISLEELGIMAKVSQTKLSNLKKNYRKIWLQEQRMAISMDVII